MVWNSREGLFGEFGHKFTVWGYCTETCLCITDSLSHTTYVETKWSLDRKQQWLTIFRGTRPRLSVIYYHSLTKVIFSVVFVYPQGRRRGPCKGSWARPHFVQGLSPDIFKIVQLGPNSTPSPHDTFTNCSKAGNWHSTEMPSCYRPQRSWGKVMFL